MINQGLICSIAQFPWCSDFYKVQYRNNVGAKCRVGKRPEVAYLYDVVPPCTYISKNKVKSIDDMKM